MARALPFTVDDGKPRRLALARRVSPHPALTPAEMEVVRLLAQGYDLHEVATILNRSYHTVKRQADMARVRKNARSKVHLISLFWASRMRGCTCGQADLSQPTADPTAEVKSGHTA